MAKKSKRKKNKTFNFFLHENIEIKKQLLGAARSLKKDEGVGDLFAGALIYASLAEYLAENLLENLRQLMYQTTYVQYAGIVFIDERYDDRKKTLGQTICELEKYFFPDKEEIMEILREITDARNNVFHNLGKMHESEMPKVGADIRLITDQAEELIKKIDVIYAGLGKIVLPPTPESSKPTEEEKPA